MMTMMPVRRERVMASMIAVALLFALQIITAPRAMARPLQGAFTGAIAGIGEVLLDISPEVDQTAGRVQCMLRSDSGDMDFDLVRSADGAILLKKDSLTIASIRVVGVGDTLVGDWSPRDGGASSFTLHRIATYRRISVPVPEPARFRSDRGDYDLTLSLNPGALRGFLTTASDSADYIHAMPISGDLDSAGHLTFRCDSIGVAFTGRVKRGGDAIRGELRTSDGKARRIGFIRRRDARDHIGSAVRPFTANLPVLTGADGPLVDTVEAALGRIVADRYDEHLRDAWFARGIDESLLDMRLGARVKYHASDLISLDVWTYGYNGFRTIYDDALLSFGIVNREPRALTLDMIFLPAADYAGRLKYAIARGTSSASEVWGRKGDAMPNHGRLDSAEISMGEVSWCATAAGLELCVCGKGEGAPISFVTIPYNELRDIIDPRGPLGRFIARR